MGVAAAFLNSTLSYAAYLQTKQSVLDGQTKLLYAAPETLLRPEVLLMLEASNVSCLAIDEAHCISEWGHDFRPEYRQLAEVRRRLPGAVCLAVTATATERVREDILLSLAIPEAGQFVASFNRDNLHLCVEPKSDLLTQTLAFLQAHRGEAGIIYCNTRNQVDELVAELQARGWPTLGYHAGLEDDIRRRHQRRFTHEEACLIVATIAFGMGINKPSVRFVLHFDLPKNIDSYYQQIGRAGRDGLPAECLLLFGYGDVRQINYFIQQQSLEEQRGARWRLDALLRFVETNGCRRVPLLAYFGEAYDAGRCEHGDNCLVGERELADLTIPAQKFLSCVKRTGERFGMTHVIDVLRGSRAKRVLARRHDWVSTYGVGQEYTRKEWQYLARQFIQQGLLEQDIDIGSLRLTPRAYDVFRGESVHGTLPAETPAAPRQAPRDELAYDQELFALLRARRFEVAKAGGLPPYMIFSDRSLMEMAHYLPGSLRAFARIHGVGQFNLEKYAEEFLPLIQRYVHGQGQSQSTRVPLITARRTKKTRKRTGRIADSYNKGLSVPDIAAQEAVEPYTVWKHLALTALEGTLLREDGLPKLTRLNNEEQEQVLASFAEHGAEFLDPVYDALSGAVNWNELRILQLVYLIREQKR